MPYHRRSRVGSNVLLTGRVGRQYVRLLAGEPCFERVMNTITVLHFRADDVFAYLVAENAKQLSAFVILNKPGINQCYGLKNPASVLLEVQGKRRVMRLITVLKALKQQGTPLTLLSLHQWSQLDRVLASRRMNPAWMQMVV